MIFSNPVQEEWACSAKKLWVCQLYVSFMRLWSDLRGADDTLPCARLSDGRPWLWQHDRCSRLFPSSRQQHTRWLRRPVSEMLARFELQRQRRRCRSKSGPEPRRSAGRSPGDSQPVAVVMRPATAGSSERFFPVQFSCWALFAWISQLFMNCWCSHLRSCTDVLLHCSPCPFHSIPLSLGDHWPDNR